MTEEYEQEDLIELWRAFSSTWKKWYKKAEENISALDITIPEYRIMTYLVENGPTPMAKLAISASISQGWITSMIDRLEEKSFVKRVRDTEDRRVINIEISQKGKKTIESARKMHVTFVDDSFSNFTNEERVRFKCLLDKLSKNL